MQVLEEFYAQATRPTKPGALAHQDAVAFVSKWLRFPVQACGCHEILSEDLSHGQDYGGVRVANPFL